MRRLFTTKQSSPQIRYAITTRRSMKNLWLHHDEFVDMSNLYYSLYLVKYKRKKPRPNDRGFCTFKCFYHGHSGQHGSGGNALSQPSFRITGSITTAAIITMTMDPNIELIHLLSYRLPRLRPAVCHSNRHGYREVLTAWSHY